MNPTHMRRLHLAGSILFVLTGVAHTIGEYSPSRPDFRADSVLALMRHTKLGGADFTLFDVMMGWGALYGAMSLLFGVQALATVGAARGDLAVIRASARVGMVAAILQSAVSLGYHTPPPLFFMIPAAILMAVAGFARLRE